MFAYHPSNAGGAVPSNLTPSNAVPSNARAQINRSQALGVVDGFLAGMRYFDVTESLKASELGDSLPEPECFSKATTPLPPDPQSADQIAFSSIRDVRDGIKSGWKHFDKVSQSLDEQIITRLRETYHDAKSLREAGVFAFRDILTGDARKNIETFFAFCSLSHVMAGLLHTRGRLDKTEILAGLPVWLDALEDQEDQEAFQKLAQNLWPEANTHSFELNTPVAMLPDSLLASASIPSIGLLSAVPFVPPSVPKRRSDALGAVLAYMDNPAGLHATKIFDAVVQYCSDNGDFWYDLSGRGIISKDNGSRLDWNGWRAGEKKSIQEQYLARLLLEKDKRDMTSRGIVSVVEGFVDMGYLQSTDETRRYMAHIASKAVLMPYLPKGIPSKVEHGPT
ncbi:uncharacterized protein NECHADRAFT_75648 [Fusarium vanettenii 77-13-4]|uniref:Uncharacterized protein n=1 Tax=Fusarium vanettenii (strain ATCC MYA-4622 / CBS 123669 / FGSC 9596 / NRRL 45880 / 77-13-4) TaxID=660122 RepID=C7YJE3_FUSV7|nr:uncharacterized protein NECHADRAFT_75648 [Fusarium vanettenii 77-13-4]EEU48259.1 hypothetical protein NECHADRAFT_75648 [Fusarium vanettenii 77-13-4]